MDEKKNPDFVLTTGDMVAAGGGKRGPQLWEKLAIDNGADFRKRPWWPAIGNHEIAGDIIVSSLPKDEQDALLHRNWKTGVENFRSFYNLPREYYSFTFRNAVFIALPFPEPADESEKWLRDELKKWSGQGKLLFVFNHMPFFTVGQKSKIEVKNEPTWITKLMTEYKVKAVFSGHDHGYYRTIRDKVPYIISAGGGAALYPATRAAEAQADDVYYFSGMYHNGVTKTDKTVATPQQFIVVVDVDGNSVQASCITSTGELLDELSLAK
jgi:3',5'-cyclic AMP phosphodiesterase CpdA